MICMNSVSDIQEKESKCLGQKNLLVLINIYYGLKILPVFYKSVLISIQIKCREVSYIRLEEFRNKVLCWRKFKIRFSINGSFSHNYIHAMDQKEKSKCWV